MYALVVWKDTDTLVPSVIGPYAIGDERVTHDADQLRQSCWRVLRCNMNEPDNMAALRNPISKRGW